MRVIEATTPVPAAWSGTPGSGWRRSAGRLLGTPGRGGFCPLPLNRGLVHFASRMQRVRAATRGTDSKQYGEYRAQQRHEFDRNRAYPASVT